VLSALFRQLPFLYANARDFLLAIGQQHFRPEAST